MNKVKEGILSNEEFDRLSEVKSILTNEYIYAKEAIYQLELFSKNRSRRAIYELRDVLEHISLALQPETAPKDARHHLEECKTHLRRSAIEPYEWLAEKKFLQIEKMVVRGKWLYALLCLCKPEMVQNGTDLMQELRDIADKIMKGRLSKTSLGGLSHMKEALEQADSLLITLKPKEFFKKLSKNILTRLEYQD